MVYFSSSGMKRADALGVLIGLCSHGFDAVNVQRGSVKHSVRQASATGGKLCKMQSPLRMLTEAISR
jgi:hypothetical protein